MKNAIRLLVLAGALLSVGALAQFSKDTTFNFYFPQFAAIYTNVTQVDFFNSTSSTVGALSANSVSGYYPGTKAGVVSCLDAATTLPAAYTVGGSGGSSNLTCDFAPNAVTKDQGFSVSGYTDASSTADTDGELLIITNASNFTTGVTTSGSISSATVYVIPGYVNNTPAVVEGTNGSGVQNVTVAAFNQNDAYDTQYTFAKVIPLLFYASVDILNTSEITTAESVTVTWTITSP
ncbi:hypothetical protein ACMC9I_01220 [Deinococcota bacterium DY0809b]